MTVPRAFLNETGENEVPDLGDFGRLRTLAQAKLGWIARQEALLDIYRQPTGYIGKHVGGYGCAVMERFSAVSQTKFENF